MDLVPVAAISPFLAASAGNTAFYAIFGVFVAAMLVLVAIIVVWAVRHDVAGRRAWRERQEARAFGTSPPPSSSAHDE
jgi:hypothetical protein